MATVNIKQAPSLPCNPDVAFSAWLDSKVHGEMIGGSAKINPKVGGKFSIWDGEIVGTTIQIDNAKRRIVQLWHYNYDDWPQDQPSKITIEFVGDRANPNGTRLRFWHSGIPEKYAKDIEKGWKEYYWQPMQKYFSTN